MADSTDGREYGICFDPAVERRLRFLESQPPRLVSEPPKPKYVRLECGTVIRSDTLDVIGIDPIR